jgi:hypothetical protein
MRVVLRHPHVHAWARLTRLIRLLLGGVLVAVGVLVGPVGLFVLAGYGMELVSRATGETRPEEPGVFAELPWPQSDVLAAGVVAALLLAVGVPVGLRLTRHGRTVVLFLRRFRDAEAIGVLSAAAAGTFGGFWRVVTLDDGRIAPLGAAAGTRRLLGGLKGLSAVIRRLGTELIPIGSACFLAAAGVVGLRYLQTGEWDLDMVTRSLPHENAFLGVIAPPPQPLGPDLPTLFYLLIVGGIILIGVGLAAGAVMISMLLFLGPAALASLAAADVDRSQIRRRARIADGDQLARATVGVVQGSRKVLAPRLVVLGVDDGWWRQSVAAFAEVAAATVVDISEPSENVLWEVQRLLAAGTRLVPIGHVPELEAVYRVAARPDPWAARLDELLVGTDVLGYTLTWFGRRRFIRALQAALLCRRGR